MHKSTPQDPDPRRDGFVKEVTKVHHEKLLLYALGLCRQFRLHHLAAADIVQDMYVELIVKWPISELRYRERGLGFLCQIIKFDTNDAWRKQKSTKRQEEVFAHRFPDKVDLHYLCIAAHTEEFYKLLEKVLKEEDYPIMKDYIQGFTYKEMAKLHGHPINTIATKIRRAKVIIKEALKDD